MIASDLSEFRGASYFFAFCKDGILLKKSHKLHMNYFLLPECLLLFKNMDRSTLSIAKFCK